MYDWYEDEPYYEPTEADFIFNEAKEKLVEALNKEVKFERDRVINENMRLKEENEKLKNKVDNIAERERRLEGDKRNLKRTVMDERLTELMKDFEVERFKAYSYSVLGPKCNKCDADRKLEYTTPSGKVQSEKCNCANDKVTMYRPESNLCTEFKINSESPSNLRMWYKKNSYNGDDYYSSSSYLKTVYNNEKYSEIDKYDMFFNTKEECQKYCDWLNREVDMDTYKEKP